MNKILIQNPRIINEGRSFIGSVLVEGDKIAAVFEGEVPGNVRAEANQVIDATGKWLKISWREFSDKVMLTAKAMAEFGIKVQENIGVYSQNMPQCLYTDFGAYGNRVVSIPMYATNSPGQIEYIINDAKIRTLFVGEQLQYNNAFKVQKDSKYLERLVVFDPAVKMLSLIHI